MKFGQIIDHELRIHDVMGVIFILGLTFFNIWLGRYAWVIISTPVQAEYREGAMILLTEYFIQHKNPFYLGNHPLMTNNYGFLYNLVVLPFALLFGNTLAVHRVLSIFFIFLSSALIALVLVKFKISRSIAWAGGSLLMAGLLFAQTPLARPDGLGEFLFLLALLLPWWRNFDNFSLIASIFLAIFAFLAKPYFILASGIVASYIFLFRSKKTGLLYGTATFGFLLLFLFMITRFFEAYFLDVILNNLSNSNSNDKHLFDQTIKMGIAFSPTIIIFLLTSIRKGPPNSRSTLNVVREQIWINISQLDQPLLRVNSDYMVYFLFCTVLVILLTLGKHVGAYLTYYFQLIVPPLIIVVFRKLRITGWTFIFTVPLILLNLYIVCFHTLYPNELTPPDLEEWGKLNQYLVASEHILNSPAFVSNLIELGKQPVDSGQSEYFYITAPYQQTIFAPDYQFVEEKRFEYKSDIRTAVRNQAYDRVMITSPQAFSPFIKREFLKKFYQPENSLTLAMPQSGQVWKIEIWEPR